MARLLILAIIFQSFQSINLFSQQKIKTETIWIKIKKHTKEKNYCIQEIRYNKHGEKIEEIHFNKRNRIIYHKAWIYDKGALQFEFELDPKGNIIYYTNVKKGKSRRLLRTRYTRSGKEIGTEEVIIEYFDK